MEAKDLDSGNKDSGNRYSGDRNLKDCTLCPRNCHVDRTAGQTGYCGQSSEIKAARAALHMWEEPCLSGQTGSGTVFFSGCNLGCVFCQNRIISSDGKENPLDWESNRIQGNLPLRGNPTAFYLSSGRLCEIFLRLQEEGACNVNLVTPSHFVPQIVESLQKARDSGLTIPVVYNTGSYEKVETLKRLEGLVDVYLPDLKYYSPELARRYSYAEDYFAYASLAIREMVRQAGKAQFASQKNETPQQKAASRQNTASQKKTFRESVRPKTASENEYAGPLMVKGVIVRHLVLPGCVADAKAILRYLIETYGNDIYISIMNQYTPLSRYLKGKYPELDRTVTVREYEKVVDYAISLGLENGFIQEGKTCLESFIPAFDGSGL